MPYLWLGLRMNAVLSKYEKQHKKALCEMLPLLLYPIFFLLFTMPIFLTAVDDSVISFLTAFGICPHLESLLFILTFVLSGASV